MRLERAIRSTSSRFELSIHSDDDVPREHPSILVREAMETKNTELVDFAMVLLLVGDVVGDVVWDLVDYEKEHLNEWVDEKRRDKNIGWWLNEMFPNDGSLMTLDDSLVKKEDDL